MWPMWPWAGRGGSDRGLFVCLGVCLCRLQLDQLLLIGDEYKHNDDLRHIDDLREVRVRARARACALVGCAGACLRLRLRASACVRACVRVCADVCVRGCVRASGHAYAQARERACVRASARARAPNVCGVHPSFRPSYADRVACANARCCRRWRSSGRSMRTTCYRPSRPSSRSGRSARR